MRNLTTVVRGAEDPPSADHLFALALARALVGVLGQKKGRRILHAMADDFADQLARAQTIPLHMDRATAERRKEAAEAAVSAYRRALPYLLGALFEE